MKRVRLLVLTVAAVVAVGAGVGGYAATRTGLDRRGPSALAGETGSTGGSGSSAGATPSAVASALSSPTAIAGADAPVPTAAAIAAALTGPLADPALGASVLAQVTDATTGQVLFTRGASTGGTPASTAKITTAAAVLATHAATDRITTTVVAGASPGQVVLVGAGDPTLSGAAAGAATPYAGAARISDLATQLKGSAVTQVVVDGQLFTGPTTAPSWQKADTPTDYAAPITAVMADGARDTPSATIRSANPDLAAGVELAADLGLPAAKVIRGNAPAGAKQLASVQSATFAQLIDEMLQQSDNVIAECLARQVAIVTQQPASFAGAAVAVRTELDDIGASIGSGLTDGSGLAATDKLTPAALVGVLRAATQRAALRPLIDDLPVAGWDGTLGSRYQSGPAAAGAGLVRAKTGTLTSVSTLAGIVTNANGRVLVFAFLAPKVGASGAATDAAEVALDTAAAALVAG